MKIEITDELADKITFTLGYAVGMAREHVDDTFADALVEASQLWIDALVAVKETER